MTIILGGAMVLVPRLVAGTWTATANPSPSTDLAANVQGRLYAIRSGGADVDLQGWIPFAPRLWNAGTLFQAELSVVSSSGVSWSDLNVYRDLLGSPSWNGFSFVNTTSIMRLKIRAKDSTAVLAQADYTINFVVA